MVTIRKAHADDIDGVDRLYEAVHDAEERGDLTIGWVRGVYPTRMTALSAMEAGELYVEEVCGRIVGAAIINRRQVDAYAEGSWSRRIGEDEALVLHTLVIDPSSSGNGYGTRFVRFYEELAASYGIHDLRMDTNERNQRARRLYARLGYREAGIIPTVFNGIEGVGLVLLEKLI